MEPEKFIIKQTEITLKYFTNAVLLMMLKAALQRPIMIEAWIIDSATYMGKDVKPIFAFDSFDLSLSRNGIERKK